MKTLKSKRMYLMLKMVVLLGLVACECALADPVWKGDFVISNASDIQALAGYEKVTGCLTIGGSQENYSTIKSLQGLESLVRVRDLHIEYTQALKNLEGLNGLTDVIGDIYIYGNSQLTSIETLEKVTKVESTIHVSNNPVLKNLAGLKNITEAGNLVITENDSLKNLEGLNALKHVGGLVAVNLNPALETLEGLDALAFAGSISIQENKSLRALPELPNLKDVPEYLVIMQNDALDHTEGFNFLTRTGETIISENENLSQVDGFKNMVETDVLCIERNNALSGIALNPQLSVKETLEIKKNPSLCMTLAMVVKDRIVENGIVPGEITINQNGTCEGQ